MDGLTKILTPVGIANFYAVANQQKPPLVAARVKVQHLINASGQQPMGNLLSHVGQRAYDRFVKGKHLVPMDVDIQGLMNLLPEVLAAEAAAASPP